MIMYHTKHRLIPHRHKSIVSLILALSISDLRTQSQHTQLTKKKKIGKVIQHLCSFPFFLMIRYEITHFDTAAATERVQSSNRSLSLLLSSAA